MWGVLWGEGRRVMRVGAGVRVVRHDLEGKLVARRRGRRRRRGRDACRVSVNESRGGTRGLMSGGGMEGVDLVWLRLGRGVGADDGQHRVPLTTQCHGHSLQLPLPHTLGLDHRGRGSHGCIALCDPTSGRGGQGLWVWVWVVGVEGYGRGVHGGHLGYHDPRVGGHVDGAGHGLHGSDEGGGRQGGKCVWVRVGRDEGGRGGGEGEKRDARGLHPPGVGVEALGHLPGEQVGEDGWRVTSSCRSHYLSLLQAWDHPLQVLGSWRRRGLEVDNVLGAVEVKVGRGRGLGGLRLRLEEIVRV